MQILRDIQILLAAIALMIFALFDYLGYNTLGKRDLPLYRKVELGFGVALFLLLGLWIRSWCAGLMAAFAWWTWWADLLFYVWAHWLKIWPAETDSFQHDVQGDLVTWAWWTPAGLLMGRAKDRTKPISGVVLLVQALLGFVQIVFLW